MKRMKKSGAVALLGAALFIFLGAPVCPRSDHHHKSKSPKPPRLVPGIVAVGGNGVNGAGGQGGGFFGVLTDNFKIMTDGEVDTSAEEPVKSEPDLGPEPWVVDKDYTLQVYDCDQEAPQPREGEYYLCLHTHLDNPDIFYYDSFFLLYQTDPALKIYHLDGGVQTVTGLWIRKGVTLTVGLNSNLGASASIVPFSAVVIVDHDLVVDGSISAATLDTGNPGGFTTICPELSTSRDRGTLELAALGSVYINGRVDNAGADAVVDGRRGGIGGSLHVYAGHDLWIDGSIDCSGGDGAGSGDGGGGCVDVYYSSCGYENSGILDLYGYSIINRGKIVSRGGAGGNGGPGGFVTYSLQEIAGSFLGQTFFNSGTIDTRGGVGRHGDGGNGGGIVDQMSGGIAHDSLVNRGTLNTSGGNAYGVDNEGPVQAGKAGYIFLAASEKMINSGRMLCAGGDAVGSGNGGAAGSVLLSYGFIYPYQSLEVSLASHGEILARGGRGVGPDSRGGGGEFVNYCVLYRLSSGCKGVALHEDFIDLSGGDGDWGGPAGSLSYGKLGWSSLEFRGISDPIRLDGGDGFTGGGGGTFDLVVDGSFQGAVFAPISAVGGAGDAESGTGGDGGSLSLTSQTPPTIFDAPFDVSGGPAATPGAEGSVVIDGTTAYP